jgi:hypothetical protein
MFSSQHAPEISMHDVTLQIDALPPADKAAKAEAIGVKKAGMDFTSGSAFLHDRFGRSGSIAVWDRSPDRRYLVFAWLDPGSGGRR